MPRTGGGEGAEWSGAKVIATEMFSLISFFPLNRYFHNVMPNASNAVTDGRATGHVFILVGGCSSSLPFSSSEC